MSHTGHGPQPLKTTERMDRGLQTAQRPAEAKGTFRTPGDAACRAVSLHSGCTLAVQMADKGTSIDTWLVIPSSGTAGSHRWDGQTSSPELPTVQRADRTCRHC